MGSSVDVATAHSPPCASGRQAPGSAGLRERLHPGAFPRLPRVRCCADGVHVLVPRRMGFHAPFPRQSTSKRYEHRPYPRPIVLCSLSVSQTHHLDKVINFTLPEHILVAKLTGRRVCDTCGRNYNVTAIDEGLFVWAQRVTPVHLLLTQPMCGHTGEIQMPPLIPQPDDCNICHGEPPLVQRADDTEEVIVNRYGARRGTRCAGGSS